MPSTNVPVKSHTNRAGSVLGPGTAADVTNGNNFHVEHHLMPGLPIDRLHDLHAVIVNDIQHFYPSYRAFYADVLRNRVAPRAAKGV